MASSSGRKLAAFTESLQSHTARLEEDERRLEELLQRVLYSPNVVSNNLVPKLDAGEVQAVRLDAHFAKSATKTPTSHPKATAAQSQGDSVRTVQDRHGTEATVERNWKIEARRSIHADDSEEGRGEDVELAPELTRALADVEAARLENQRLSKALHQAKLSEAEWRHKAEQAENERQRWKAEANAWQRRCAHDRRTDESTDARPRGCQRLSSQLVSAQLSEPRSFREWVSEAAALEAASAESHEADVQETAYESRDIAHTELTQDRQHPGQRHVVSTAHSRSLSAEWMLSADDHLCAERMQPRPTQPSAAHTSQSRLAHFRMVALNQRLALVRLRSMARDFGRWLLMAARSRRQLQTGCGQVTSKASIDKLL